MVDGLVDSNIVIDLLRQDAKAISWYGTLGKQRLGITPVVWMECVEGARNLAEKATVIRFMKRFSIEYPTKEDNKWAMMQVQLSHGTEWADVMTASVAARLKVPLYTRNIKNFEVLPNVDEIAPY